MKRDRALIAFLGIFLILIVNPCAYVDSCTRGIEHQEAMFSTAADGDESSESLTSFSETLDDDVLFYPDAFHNDTVVLASAGSGSPNDGGTNYTATHAKDVDYFYAGDLAAPADVDMLLNFTIPSGFVVEAVDINLYVTTDVAGILYAYDGSAWHNVGGFGAALAWYNMTFDEPNGLTSNLELNLTIDNAGTGEIFLDYAEVQYYVMHLANSDHYAEGFNGVSDWTTSDTSISTDDDVATITENGAGSTGRAYDPISSTDFFEYYYEFRIESMTATTANLEFWDGAAYNTLKTFTAAGTYKGIISDADAATMQRIGFLVGSEGGNIKPDYLRIGNSTSMGWQHDGSTTAGVEEFTNSEYDYYISTDGDVLNMTSKRGTGSDTEPNAYYKMYYDTTATALDLENTYYQFLEFRYCATGTGDRWIYAYMDGNVQTQPLNGDGEWHTERINIAAAGAGSSLKYIRWSLDYTYVDDRVATLLLDFSKYYSIANWTYSSSGVDTDDYLYVNSGVLYSNIDDGYIELNHDPTLSVSDTYGVYNLTTSGTAPQFSQYVSDWSTYSDDTRGATTTGTVTDIKFKFDSTEILSAIKFIEDGTAPDILDKFVTPIIPDDDESVTLTAVTYDAVEVYEVTINAVVYPAGFNDIDYDLTEQTDDVLWSYEFSTLTAGYYLFQVTANDGANTYSEYIPVTVRVSIIEITTYTFFGASSDFSYMQYSGHISHDCTYNISEWSTSWAKNETHTGSVSEGMFNIAWDKISVDDAEANFTIVFVSGSLSLTIDGYYGTAYKLLRIIEIEVMNMEESLALTNITINFYTNKDVDWYVYDRDDDDTVLSSGSSVEGSDDLYFLKNRIPYAHYYAVKWTDGVTDIWYNSSYWTYRQNIDSIDPPWADWEAKDQRKTIEFWVTVTAIIGGFGLIVIAILQYGTRQHLKALQLPRYRTQERDRK